MTIPPSLIPTLDALLSSGARWLPLGEARTNYFPRVRYLRAAHEAFFDLIAIRSDEPTLDWVGEVEELYEREPSLFAPALEHGVLEPIPLEGAWLERARFVDGLFPALWGGLELGTIDVQCGSEDRAVIRRDDGSYWNVGERGGELVFAELTHPGLLVWLLRSRLWRGTSLRARPLSPALQPRLDDAVSVEAILRAPLVDVTLKSTTLTGLYRLQGHDAFHFTETGEERPSADYTSPYPETVYDYLPCPRADVERALHDVSTVVLKVDYAARP